MAKSADYFISGVWKDNNDNVTHVLLHEVEDGNSFKSGLKTNETTAINLIKNNNVLYTITWGYPNWQLGAELTYVQNNYNNEYLRTVPNASLKDNLDNSINMQVIK